MKILKNNETLEVGSQGYPFELACTCDVLPVLHVHIKGQAKGKEKW